MSDDDPQDVCEMFWDEPKLSVKAVRELTKAQDRFGVALRDYRDTILRHCPHNVLALREAVIRGDLAEARQLTGKYDREDVGGVDDSDPE